MLKICLLIWIFSISAHCLNTPYSVRGTKIFFLRRERNRKRKNVNRICDEQFEIIETLVRTDEGRKKMSYSNNAKSLHGFFLSDGNQNRLPWMLESVIKRRNIRSDSILLTLHIRPYQFGQSLVFDGKYFFLTK